MEECRYYYPYFTEKEDNQVGFIWGNQGWFNKQINKYDTAHKWNQEQTPMTISIDA
jgi:hypothetical protein